MGKWLLIGLVFVIFFSGCAAGPNPNKGSMRDEAENPAGFWLGLWHGFIVPFAFIVSWFKSSVGIYEVYNNGFWYNLGFVIGLMIIFGGSGGGSTTAVRK